MKNNGWCNQYKVALMLRNATAISMMQLQLKIWYNLGVITIWKVPPRTHLFEEGHVILRKIVPTRNDSKHISTTLIIACF